MSSGTEARILSVDAMRIFAVTGVVARHSLPFVEEAEHPALQCWQLLFYQAGKFSVPFFFTIAGYFFGRKLAANDGFKITAAGLRRIGPIWVVWSVIYLLPFDFSSAAQYGWLGPAKIIYWKMLHVLGDPMQYLFHGLRSHLWFLASLATCIALAGLVIRFPSSLHLPLLIGISASLYVIGLLSHPYAQTPIGMSVILAPGQGYYFGFLFFATGFGLSRYPAGSSYLRYGLLALVFGWTLHLTEIHWLHFRYQIPLFKHNFLLGTYFMGLGAALCALSNHRWLQLPWIARFGKYTLGIYAIHMVFVQLFAENLRNCTQPAVAIGYVGLVLACSLASSIVLSKIRPLKPLVV